MNKTSIFAIAASCCIFSALAETLVDYPLYGASGQIVCGSYKGNNFGTDIPFCPLFGVKEDYNLLHNLYYWTLTLPEIEDAVANIFVNDGYSDSSSSAYNGEFFSFWHTYYEATPTYNPVTRLWTMDMIITLGNVASIDPKFPSDASCEFTLGIDPVRDPSLEYDYSWAATPSNRWARCVFPFSGSAHFRIQFDSFAYQWKVLIVE